MTSLCCFMLTFMWIACNIMRIHAETIRSTQDNDFEQRTLNCTAGQSCDIYCAHPSACLQSIIRCPSGHTCNVTCSDDYSCEDVIIYAQDASSFHLLDCASGRWTCIGLSLYLPPSDHNQPNAFLIGGDKGLSAGENNLHPLHFYGIYGWNDVDIVVSNKHTFDNHEGVMHCAEDYSSSCNFSDNAWSCEDPNHLCNKPQTTLAPTRITTFPTTNPTHNPTVNPSMVPTASPSITPTVIPTHNPTYIQTTINSTTFIPVTNTSNSTTNNSTSIPTLVPTISPTYDAHTSSINTIISTESSVIFVAEKHGILDRVLGLHPLYFVIIGLVVLLLCFVSLFVFWCYRVRKQQKVKPLNDAISKQMSNEKEASKEGDPDQDETERNIRIEIAPLKVAKPLRLNSYGHGRHSRAISAGSALSALSGLTGLSGISKSNSIKSPSEYGTSVDHRHQLSHMDLSHLRPMSMPAPSQHQTTASVMSNESSLGVYASVVNNNDGWEEQMSALKQQWQHIRSMSPVHNNVQTETAANFGDPLTHNDSDPIPNVYDDVPSTAPAIMDHNVFFNQMLRTFGTQPPNAMIQPMSFSPHDETTSQVSDNVSVLSGVHTKHSSDDHDSSRHTTSSDSDTSESTIHTLSTTNTNTTATSMTATTATTASHKTRGRKHFRPPSVMTDRHLSEDEASVDLPRLIEADDKTHHDLNMIPETDEDSSSSKEFEVYGEDENQSDSNSSTSHTETYTQSDKPHNMERISEENSEDSYHDMFALTKHDIHKSFNPDDDDLSDAQSDEHSDEYYDEYED